MIKTYYPALNNLPMVYYAVTWYDTSVIYFSLKSCNETLHCKSKLFSSCRKEEKKSQAKRVYIDV